MKPNRYFWTGAAAAVATLAIMATGPGTVTFPNTTPYGVTFDGNNAYHSTTAVVDISNPAIGQKVNSDGSTNTNATVSGTIACSNCSSGGSSGQADESTFTQGTGVAQPVGGLFTSSPTNLTTGQFGILRLTADRAAWMNLQEVGGAAFGLGQTTMAASLPVAIASNQGSIPTGTHTLTDVAFDPGTNGFTVAPFSVLTTELNTLASAGVATSSVNGSSGKFSQTSTSSGLFGRCWMKLGAALGGTAVSGANFSIWFLTSTDGGTTFESQTVSPPPRSPDIIIPVGASNYAANAILMSPPRQNLWAETVKIVLQNNTGQAMGASGNILTCAPQAALQ